MSEPGNHHTQHGATEACHEFDLNLEPYLEGEARPQVPAHARECAYCAVILADLEQIRATCLDLPLDDPPARLWSNIRARLADEGIIHEPRSRWDRWFPRLFPNPAPLAALASLAVVALALLLSPVSYDESNRSMLSPGSEPIMAAGLLPAGVDSELVRTVKEMEQVYWSRESSVEPALKDTYQKSLEALDASIDECARHCRREPGNALARKYLMLAYQSKAEVLASALEHNNR